MADRDDDGPAGTFASPPCFMHEVDPAYTGLGAAGGGTAAIEYAPGGFTVDAAVLAEAFGLAPGEVQARMREGRITSRVERGEGEDAGRHRLTFFCGNARLRLVVGEDGAILWRSLLDFGDRPLPAAARRAGGVSPASPAGDGTGRAD